MSLLLKLKRTSLLGLHIVKGIRQASKYKHLVDQGIPNAEFQSIRQQWLKEMCSILPLDIEVEGTPTKQTGLWVSNHVSWMDIPVIGCLAPVGFLSKAEVAKWPIVGKLAARTGTLFIQRGGNSAAAKAIETMGLHLDHDHSVLFFPEGTTTDGAHVRTFHPRLFSAAIDHERWIQPVSIRYFDSQGKLSTVAPFIGDSTFQSSFWDIIGAERMRVVVKFLPVIKETKDLARKNLAKQLQNMIQESII